MDNIIYTFALGRIKPVQFSFSTYGEAIRTMQILDELDAPYTSDVQHQKCGRPSKERGKLMPKLYVKDAAKLLNPSLIYVRAGIRQRVLDIGSCVRHDDSSRYSYDIRPDKLADYMGISIDELYKRLEVM